MRPNAKTVLLFIGFLILMLCLWEPASSQVKLTVSEKSLTFRGLVGETLQRTFMVSAMGKPVKGFSVVPHDLIDPATGVTILSDRITVKPEVKDEISGPTYFTVTVEGDRAGDYKGVLELKYADQPPESPVNIDLDVHFTRPSVEADTSSKNLVLLLQPSWSDSRFMRSTASPGARVLAETSISLMQKTEGKAEIEQVRVMGPRNTDGQTLPAGAISVKPEAPFTLSGTGADLHLSVAGRNLKPGEYNGAVLVKVSEQKEPVQVSLQVKVKDGLLLPLLILAIGPIVGALLAWWNKQGSELNRLRREIKRLNTSIETDQKLQIQDRENATKLLEKAMDLMIAGEKAEEINKQFELAKKAFEAALARAEEFLAKNLQPLRQKTENLDPGTTYRQSLLDSLKTLEDQVIEGAYNNLQEAQDVLNEIDKNVTAFEKVIEKFNALTDDKKKDLRDKLDKADDLDEMRKILEMDDQEFSVLSLGDTSRLEEPESRKVAWEWLKFGLKWRALMVTIVVYLFTLAVGWVSVYETAPTFGADLKDYITLFLWGVVATGVGGRTVNLQAIFQKTKETRESE